jgi:DNA (cytosine-5)-methyltransferase 1
MGMASKYLNPRPMRSIELFAGCGGLAFGLAEAGFKHVMVVERDPHASATLTANKAAGVRHYADWNVQAVDVKDVDYANVSDVDLVAGGPPCQPFSIGGKHKGPSDRRNMWDEAIRAVRELRPKAFLFENVRGLLRPNFESYLAFLKLQLSWPEVHDAARGWREHTRELEAHSRTATPTYRVLVQGINTADYGAPQKRHRAILLAVRADVADDLKFPGPTHSREALLWNQRVNASYWERHSVSKHARPVANEADKALLKRLRAADERPLGHPWLTVRDAIGDLPRPATARSRTSRPAPTQHVLHPGARVYDRHTGSTWDEPAKALKAGDHGVPGGENIIVGPRGVVRYFTIREMARLQGLPDEFDIDGTWKYPIKQLGNAVPVQVGLAFGTALREAIEGGRPAAV